MRFLLFCVLVAMCKCNATDKLGRLKEPRPLRIEIKDEPPAFDITWPKVHSVDEADPVIGYKVKVLEVKKIKRIIHKVDSGSDEIKTVELYEYPKINAHRTPEGNETILIVPASENPMARFEGWKHEVAYQITVLAYTNKQEGPASSPIRVRVNA